MPRLFAIPIAPGTRRAVPEIYGELKDNRYEDFPGIKKKIRCQGRTFFQQTPIGGLIIVTLEGENPEQAFMEFEKDTDAFTKWFIEQVKVVIKLI